MRNKMLGVLAGLLVAGRLIAAEPDAPPVPAPAPPAEPSKPTPDAAPETPPPPRTLTAAPLPPPAAVGPIHLPTEMPAFTTSWQRLPSDCLLGPPPGICPNPPCPPKPWDADRFWLRAEVLCWWLENDRYLPLASVGSTSFPVVPGDNVAAGRIDHGAFPGIRIGVGGWIDDSHNFGVDASFFVLAQESYGRLDTSTANPELVRPFFNLNTQSPGALIVGFPGLATGAVHVTSPTDFDGFEVNGRIRAYDCWNDHIDALAGVRYLNLDERLNVGTEVDYAPSLLLPPALSSGGLLTAADGYHTRNQFVGGQLGGVATFQRDRWDLRLRGTVALGGTNESLAIAGSSALVSPLGTTTAAGGVLAQPSNIGTFNRERFSVVPEVSLELGYRVCEHVRLSLGYDCLYWSSVIRAASQADLVVDVSQSPFLAAPAAPTGENRPAAPFRETGFFAQGIHVAMEVRY